MALSDARVKAATVPDGKNQIKISDGGGLYLLVKQVDKRKTAADAKAATFKGVAIEWLNKKSTQWTATTLKHKKAELNNHIFPWMGEMKLTDIEPMDIFSVCQRIENNDHNEAAHSELWGQA